MESKRIQSRSCIVAYLEDLKAMRNPLHTYFVDADGLAPTGLLTQPSSCSTKGSWHVYLARKPFPSTLVHPTSGHAPSLRGGRDLCEREASNAVAGAPTRHAPRSLCGEGARLVTDHLHVIA